MDCITYINDLIIEIDTLKKINSGDIEIENKIKEKQKLIDDCKNNLSKLSDCKIEYRIYLKMLNGLSPTKAVEEVAKENYLKDIKPSSIARIWDHYKSLKKILK